MADELTRESYPKDLLAAIVALEAISDPKRSSLRMRDADCVRFIASDALDELAKQGLVVGGTRWGPRHG